MGGGLKQFLDDEAPYFKLVGTPFLRCYIFFSLLKPMESFLENVRSTFISHQKSFLNLLLVCIIYY